MAKAILVLVASAKSKVVCWISRLQMSSAIVPVLDKSQFAMKSTLTALG